MRNKNIIKNFIISILILISIYFINKYNKYAYIKYNFINYIYKIIYNNKKYINIKINKYKNIFNDKNNLLENNLILKKKLTKEKLKNLILKKYKKENFKLKKILNIPNINYKLITSKILNINHSESYMLIKNSNKNVKLGDFVINDYGLVGRIINIKNNISKVLLITSRKFLILSKINKNNIKFILKGCGYKNELYIFDEIDIINDKDDLKLGDIIVFYDKNYPFLKNLEIGKIKSLKIINKRINKMIIVPSFYNTNLNYIFILTKL